MANNIWYNILNAKKSVIQQIEQKYENSRNTRNGAGVLNIQTYTQKSMQAIQDCEKLAYEYGNQEIEQEHLLVALMRQEDGLIPMLIEKMEIN